MYRLSSHAFVVALFATCFSAQAFAQQPAPAPAPADDSGSQIPPEDLEDEDAPKDKPAEKKPSEEKKKPSGEKQGKPADHADEGDEGGDEEFSEEDLDAELAAESAKITKPAPKGKGVVWGVVKDANEHETLPEAQVTVPGSKFKTLADIDGRFRLELPPGTYNVKAFFELHHATTVKEIVVQEGQLVRVDIDLLPDEAEIETVEVVATADRSTLEGQLLTRQKDARVGDGVGRAEISKTPASNAAQAAQRVVGATIVGNRFVYVRGLGERYTNAQLNGAPLPSPEPDRAAIPLDLFPSLILESVNIVKTFTPDMPADFAGGSVQIETRELPSKPLFQLSAGIGYDTNTTFQERLAQRSSGTDWLGFDSGMRGLPDGFPKYALGTGQEKPGGGTITEDDLLSAGRMINSPMHPETVTSMPNYSFSAVAGKGWDLGGEKRFGALASINYSRSFKKRENISIRQFKPMGAVGEDGAIHETVVPVLSLRSDQGNDKVNWGSLGSVSYWPSKKHRFTVMGMHTQLADATASLYQGYYESRNADVTTVDLRYVSRALNVLQLRGEHDLPDFNRAEVRWYLAYSVATRDQPDTRDTVYQFKAGTDESWNAVNTPENGSHFFSSQDEKSYGGGLDFTQPLTKNPDDVKLKSGGLVTIKERDFQARRFTLGRRDRFRASDPGYDLFFCGPVYRLGCPVPLYQDQNIGPVLSFTEYTKGDSDNSDEYRADLKVYAGYLMLDANVLPEVRLVGGVRVERTDQNIDPYTLVEGGVAPEGGHIRSTDWLPALSVTYSATKKTKFRAALSKTLARPQLRELAPFVFADYFGAYPISGNPNLKLTYIKNADLRYEVYPTGREVVAFSFFYKVFEDPIEPYVFPSGTPGIIKYQNAEGATLVGVELEARKNLGFLAEVLHDFSFIGNLTLAHSRIQIDTSGGLVDATNPSRAMVNQAPYVINLALDYENDPLGFDARILYNVIGPRITQVGTGQLDDTYAQPQHTIDASIGKKLVEHVQLKLTGTNLIDAPVRETIGKANRSDRLALRYRDGRVFTLTGSYTF